MTAKKTSAKAQPRRKSKAPHDGKPDLKSGDSPKVESPDGIGGFRSAQDAIDAMCKRLAKVKTIRCPLSASSGLILAQDVVADRPSPPVSVSAMDGYAVSRRHIRPGTIPVAAESRIGAPPPPFKNKTSAIRIVTGAPIPKGADAVIKRELVTDESPASISISAKIIAQCKKGQSIRAAGENGDKGDKVARAGALITAPVASAMAAFGAHSPLVYRKIRVAIITTGDELVAVERKPTPYQLRDSNGPALHALLTGASHRWLEVSQPTHVRDDSLDIATGARAALMDHDVLVFTGGVSMGQRDFVPAVIRELKAEIIFHKIPQRPGRPVLGAIDRRGRLIMALPGNPLSVMVTARRMLVPMLMHLAGYPWRQHGYVQVTAESSTRIPMWSYRLVEDYALNHVRVLDSTGSADIVAAAGSDGFIEVQPRDRLSFKYLYAYYPWQW